LQEISLASILLNMHSEIFSKTQNDLLPFMKKYKRNYYLVGGTAIALHIGHRYSIDFDMFTAEKINSTNIKKDISISGFSSSIIRSLPDQIHFIVNDVKLTFFEYPFSIESKMEYENYFRLPDLLTLAAMKAFALGGRGKWKDYVDLYFLLKQFYSVEEIAAKAKEVFKDGFNPILFRKQLCYFEDINYSEQVDFLPGFETGENIIKQFLTDAALTGF
jgi:hypothetical protein